MNTRRRHSIVLATLTTLALAACGGTPASDGPAGTSGPGATAPAGTAGLGGAPGSTQSAGGGERIDGCTLLTADDIRDVTGLESKAKPPAPQFGIFPAGCEWDLVDDGAMVPPTMSLGIMTTGGRAYYDTHFAPYHDEMGFTPIEGLGDEAVDAGAGSVLVVAGDTFLDMQYIAIKPDDTEHATELARKVLANLGARS